MAQRTRASCFTTTTTTRRVADSPGLTHSLLFFFFLLLSVGGLWLCPPRKSKNGIEHSLINLSEKDFLVLLSQREGRVPGSTPRPHPVLDVIPRHFAFETLHAHVFIFSAQLTSLVPYFLLSLSICNWERLPFLQRNDRERTLGYNVSGSLPGGVGKSLTYSKKIVLRIRNIRRYLG
jgi:hypothetical protein